MAENNKIYITANELAEMLGVSVGHAYKLIRKLNEVIGNVRHIVTIGIMDNIVCMFAQFFQTAVIAKQL